MDILEISKIVSDTTHHDAITGTSKKYVNNEDYYPKIKKAEILSNHVMRNTLGSIFKDEIILHEQENNYSFLNNDEVFPITVN
jgi:hypothetical protein